MENFAKRLKYYIERQLNTTIKKFEENCGFSQGSINRVIKSGTNIGVDKIILISRKYPELNMDWLLSGEGKPVDNIMQEPAAIYQTTESTKHDIVMELTKALVRFSENDAIRASSESTLIETNRKLADKLLTL